MIVRMRKYAFLVYHKEYQSFLEKLHAHGVVHVVSPETDLSDDDELAGHRQAHKRAMQAIKELKQIKPAGEPAALTPEATIDRFYELAGKRDRLSAEAEQLKKACAQLEPWGEFDPAMAGKLAQSRRELRLFTCPARNYRPEWEEQYDLFVVNREGSLLYLALLADDTTPPLEADPVKIPGESLSQLREKLAAVGQLLDEVLLEIKQLAAGTQQLEAHETELMERYTFEKVLRETGQVAGEKVSALYGWVPADRADELESFLRGEAVVFEAGKPEREDDVPVLLKNNRFSRLFERIGELYSLPKYAEMDLTAYFAPFYWLFFGFCLGDAGYGILLALTGFALRNRFGEALRNVLTLIGLLGLSTILFGIIGGTFFGLNLYELKFSVWGDVARYFDPEHDGSKFNINEHLFNLALLLGAVQILFGMLIRVVNESRMFGLKNALGSLGWLILVVGGLLAYGLSALGAPALAVDVAAGLTLALGGAGAFLFNNTKRHVLLNIGAGLWDAYNMVTGLMGDLLSYIRLFALGISSAILGYVFNSLALALAPDFPVLKWVVVLLILLIGHGINLFMGALGSFVHPMRLTFVEFYKNSGFAGGGKKYQPFAKTTNK